MRISRGRLLTASLVCLAACLAALFAYPVPQIAYAGIILLALATGLYLLPESRRGKSLAFPRTHPHFRFLTLLNLASVPLTFAFVLAGLAASISPAIWPLLLLAAARMVPSLAFARILHSRRLRLIEETSAAPDLSRLGESPMSKATGFVYETRTRRRILGRTLYNLWLTDHSGSKAFIPGITEVRGITEKVREGSRCTVVGPVSTLGTIAAIQPAASALAPADWQDTDSAWMNVVWQRARWSRLITSVGGSAVYVLAIVSLSWIVRSLSGGQSMWSAVAVVSALSSAFFWALTEKAARESGYYDVSNYFEPSWKNASAAARRQRLERLRHQSEVGEISGEYLEIVERQEGWSTSRTSRCSP